MIFIIPKGKPFLTGIYIHAIQIRRAFQRQHIAAVLVQLDKIAPMLVEDGKVCGDNGVLGKVEQN